MSEILLKNIRKTYDNGTTVIENLDLKIESGSFTVLVGPSGCGKSTTLRMIAGLEDITGGEIYIDGKCMNAIQPGDRDIAMVFQNYALYPTMSVKGNIEFGLINAKIPKQERERLIDEIVDIVDLRDHLHKKPSQLSGGQRQRVALARAMVKKPKVFLMDEPLSNLDAKLRNQMRSELIELHHKLGATFVYVTHDQVEALSMATDIVLMEKGVIRQHSTPHEIYVEPQNVFTAQFIGTPEMNVLTREKVEKYIDLDHEVAYIGFRPSKVKLYKEGDEQEDKFVFEGYILTREMLGSEVIYRVQTQMGVVAVKVFNDVELELDDQVKLSLSYKHMYGFDKSKDRIKGSES
ncbi:ABC transporter ATP-binding protein [Niameybacter massiliensis]|uniref:ABC transporter ATP-binding protein n=1 Tax=Holtiella tumoricola TaxID=3018743 RepID=A0AA42DPC7_9FIRM|nr:ABC transporter ATP-binding protein [Holtiella tumoricola]MDA3732660.1 ABC transporter ATP-binding protein [Holtiella tumoricola]